MSTIPAEALSTRNIASPISWPGIIGGAVAAAALSLILLALGAGLGLSSVSPWAYEGASAKTIGFASVLWLLLMAAAASGLGGYLAGRFRARWPDADADEVFFRDTAHGFLAWAVATILSAAVLTSAASSMVGASAKTVAGAGAAVAGTAAAGGAAAVAKTPDASGVSAGPADGTDAYFVDMMFRGAKPDSVADLIESRREASAILFNGLADGVSQGDRAYLTQMVASRTGLSQAEAEQRVTQTTNAAKLTADAANAKAREAAEAARKATAYTALWVFVSLLLGAFCASLTATWGGRERDGRTYRRQAV